MLIQVQIKKYIIDDIINNIKKNRYNIISKELFNYLNIKNSKIDTYYKCRNINNDISIIKKYILDIKHNLDKSIHAQNNVKREIQRIFQMGYGWSTRVLSWI